MGIWRRNIAMKLNDAMFSFFLQNRKEMKAFQALIGSSLMLIAFCLAALMMTGCEQTAAPEQPILPAKPTTLVYAIEPDGPFDRQAIAHSQNRKPETFKLQGEQAFVELNELDSEEIPSLEMPEFDEFKVAFEASAYSTEISILKAETCKSVFNNDPIEPTDQFELKDGKAWLACQVSLPEGKYGLITHVWKREGKEMGRIELLVEGPNYRTNSNKLISKGEWTVEIQTENGEVLEEIPFSVI
jgi:hypothetical protein